MTPDLVIAATVAIVSTVAVLVAILPIVSRRDRELIKRLEGRIDELGAFQERMLRIIFGAETREHPRLDHGGTQ